MQLHALLKALKPHRRTLTLGDALLALPDYQVSDVVCVGDGMLLQRLRSPSHAGGDGS
jgi:hypothetical protein